ncbi:hypothetical protein NIIDMKKI_79640 [Mycobacterium kansasii]|uniref:3-oxoacyl-[acyl-carrier-protein] reductase MabA n=1 Tax=Mycobacterium kansasii TaxID=1768 RepID=A0A7G1IVC2_MYCKA|nr:hypothetical protein NIIDMKKI_79640 [Mycobacterium kansasii]
MTARVSFDFTGTTALVTGGTSGIGHAIATLFRDAGAEVAVTGTKAAAADYETDLSGMTYHRLHLVDADSVDQLVRRFSRLDVLVNNAGANFPGGLDESKPDGFDTSVTLNLTGPYRLTVGLRRALKASTASGVPAWSTWHPCLRCERCRWYPATAPPRRGSSRSPGISRSSGPRWEYG